MLLKKDKMSEENNISFEKTAAYNAPTRLFIQLPEDFLYFQSN